MPPRAPSSPLAATDFPLLVGSDDDCVRTIQDYVSRLGSDDSRKALLRIFTADRVAVSMCLKPSNPTLQPAEPVLREIVDGIMTGTLTTAEQVAERVPERFHMLSASLMAARTPGQRERDQLRRKAVITGEQRSA